MTLLRHISACNRFDPAEFRAFSIAGRPFGLVRGEIGDFLGAEGLAQKDDGCIGIAGGGFDRTSAQLALIVGALGRAGLMAAPRGEMTPVIDRWGRSPIAEIDRAGLPALGLPAFGVHVNGHVGHGSAIHLWVGRRAMDRQVAPGKLDHLVAGGIPTGLTIAQTLVKEADEEAGLSPALARLARPVGLISYRLALPEGVRNDQLFLFDLELPPEIIPANRDGEVETFELWPIDRVIATLRDTDDFKFNVNLVLIDFLIRHALIDPDHEPDYALLAKGLRR